MFLDDVDNHVPLTTINDGSLKEEVHQSAVDGLARFPLVEVCHVVQKVIATLHLLPEDFK